MPDATGLLQAYNHGRDVERLHLKYTRMAADVFAFFRGSCHLYYTRLHGLGALAEAPAVWACGDLHLENFGSYKGDNRQVYFDINDFDEAVLAPATWDIVRVLSSVLVAKNTLGVSRREARSLCNTLLEAYAKALAHGSARWVERETAEPPVGTLLTRVRERKQRTLLAARTRRKGSTRRIRLDSQKALPASAEQTRSVRRLLKSFAAEKNQHARFEVLDVARRVAGIGSLGVERYVVLVHGEGTPGRNHLLDLKAALPPCAVPPGKKFRQPNWPDDAQRIVRVQCRMQAIPMAWLDAVQLEEKPFVMRRLLPSEDRVALTSVRGDALQVGSLLRTVAQCLAWAQLRSSGREGAANTDALIAFGGSDTWRKPLLALAEAAAAQAEADYSVFKKAYARGELGA